MTYEVWNKYDLVSQSWDATPNYLWSYDMTITLINEIQSRESNLP